MIAKVEDIAHALTLLANQGVLESKHHKSPNPIHHLKQVSLVSKLPNPSSLYYHHEKVQQECLG
jgi:hypothetical protein